VEDPEGISWEVDLENGVIHWDGGFVTPIVEMLDAFHREVDEPRDAVILMVAMPPEGLIIGVDIRDLNIEDIGPLH
jgi:hypothetical protein